jgi:hypothetical protein
MCSGEYRTVGTKLAMSTRPTTAKHGEHQLANETLNIGLYTGTWNLLELDVLKDSAMCFPR